MREGSKSDLLEGIIVFGLGDFAPIDLISISELGSSSKPSLMVALMLCDFDLYLSSGNNLEGAITLFLLGEEVSLLCNLRK